MKHKKKKILFFLASFKGGGAEQVFIRLLNFLSASKYDVSVFINRNRGEHLGRLNDNVKKEFSLIEWLPFAVLQFAFSVWRHRPSVVYVTITYPLAIIGFLRFLFPSRTIFVGRVTNLLSRELDSISSSLIRKIIPQAVRNYDKLICQSKDMKNDLISTVSNIESPIMIINNPIPEISIKTNKRDGFVCIGRLSKQKNYDLAIKAFSKLNLRLDIYGIGPEEKFLKELNKSLNNEEIKFQGFTNNVESILANAEALIVTSDYEGFSNVIVEALACGTPVISKNFPGGQNETLDESNSIRFEGNDPQSLINALKEFQASYFDHSAIAKSAQKKFGISKISAQYLNLMNK